VFPLRHNRRNPIKQSTTNPHPQYLPRAAVFAVSESHSGRGQHNLLNGPRAVPDPAKDTELLAATRKASLLLCGQVLGLLVPVSSTRYHASTSGLSTRSSPGGLTHSRGGRPHLKASFPLRCFQRLSLPNVANQPCSWRNNWHTRGSSVPVLSY
jgi:hypothetical protein